MAHMQPEIYYGDAYDCDTDHGREIVPLELVGIMDDDATPAEQWARVSDYLEGKPMDADTPPELVTGWLARMQAPGYLDCTPWAIYDTEAEAREALSDMYGDD